MQENNKSDIKVEGETTLPIVDKYLKNGTVKEIATILNILTVLTGIMTLLFNYLIDLFIEGYSNYLGLNKVSLNLRTSSIWETFFLATIFTIALYMLYYYISKIWKHLNYKFLFLSILIIIFTIIVYILLKIINIGMDFLTLFVLFAIMIYPTFLMNHHVDKQDNLSNSNSKKKCGLGTKFYKIYTFIRKIFQKIKPYLYYGALPLVLLLLSIFATLFITNIIQTTKDAGEEFLLTEKTHTIVTIEDNSYLLLQDNNKDKIIMKIVSENTNPDKSKKYYVKKGEYKYLKEYDNLTVRVENCKIDVKAEPSKSE